MKILEPKYEILPQGSGIDGVYRQIELCGRTCYASSMKIEDGSAKPFVERMVSSNHLAMCEHGTIYLKAEYHTDFATNAELVERYQGNKFSKVNIVGDYAYITTNYRVIVENEWFDDLDFMCEPTEWHEKRVTVRFTTQIAVSREANRHRVNSIAEQSTRYCVAGNTMLKFKNPHWKYTIEDLYNKKTSGVDNGSWKRVNIRQLDEKTGILYYGKIKNIFYNGEKEIYEINTRLGYKLQCTKEHQIYTPKGYVMLGEINVGDRIYVNGISVNAELLYRNRDWLYYQNISLDKTFKQIAEEFGFGVEVLKKWVKKLGIPRKKSSYFNVGRTPWNLGLHYHSRREIGKYFRKYQVFKKESCELCGSTVDLEVHHLDENHDNNEEDNLITLCKSCHMKVHAKSLDVLREDAVTSIKYIGKMSVYDLEMFDNHNYVANGVVVHNCNYSKDKFGGEISINKPMWVKNERPDGRGMDFDFLAMVETIGSYTEWCPVAKWWFANKVCEKMYLSLVEDDGLKPQDARAILPLDTNTELIHTAFVSDWSHFFDLRALGTTGKPHPDIEVLATPLMNEFKKRGLI